MKFKSACVLLALLPSFSFSVEIDAIVKKSASYFCEGNKNFLACIKPGMDFDSQQCIDYVAKKSRSCVDSTLSNLSDESSPKEIEQAAILYTQCSMIELIKAEGIEFSYFTECFSSKYDESNVHPKLNN